MKLGQRLEKIASDLVEEISVIEPIYKAAEKFAPDYEPGIARMWEQFRKRNYFVGDLEWKEVSNGVLDVIDTYIGNHL